MLASRPGAVGRSYPSPISRKISAVRSPRRGARHSLAIDQGPIPHASTQYEARPFVRGDFRSGPPAILRHAPDCGMFQANRGTAGTRTTAA